MGIIPIIFRPIIIFSMVASFSLFFASLFVIAGAWTTRINRDVMERQDERKSMGGYIVLSWGTLISGVVSLIAMYFL